MGDIKYIDPQEFRDGGYLQEANRRFFHPLGLAIEMAAGEPSTIISLKTLKIMLDDLNPNTEKEVLDEIDRAIENSERAIFSGVWDYRDDPEGMRFEFVDFKGNESFPAKSAEEQRDEFLAKFEAIKTEWHARKSHRTQALGYMVQPVGDHHTELGSDIVVLWGQAMGDELHSVIPVKAGSKSWQQAARGVLDKISERIAGEPYDPAFVTAEEVHLIDLLLMGEQIPEARTRAEAINMLSDRARDEKARADSYKELFDNATHALNAIATGDFEPGMDPQDVAKIALEGLAGDIGG